MLIYACISIAIIVILLELGLLTGVMFLKLCSAV